MWQVGSYARHYRYSPAEQAEVSDRLQAVTRLLKQHDCADSGQLLDAAARAEASLETWFHAEGAAPYSSLKTCTVLWLFATAISAYTATLR